MKPFRAAEIIATCALVGKIPFASGTWGSLAGLLFYVAVSGLPIWLHLTFIAVLFFVGLYAIRIVSSIWGTKDDRRIVIDEFVGIYITLLGLPLILWQLVLGFVLFRLFDILKPPGARYFDRNDLNGWGVMLDDVVAALYALVSLNILLRFI